MVDELKPCPFCGSSRVSHAAVAYGHNAWCEGCGARCWICPMGEAASIERWNTRAGDTITEAAWRKANLLGVELAEARAKADAQEAAYAEDLELLVGQIDRLKAEVRSLRNQVADGTPGEYELRGWGMW